MKIVIVDPGLSGPGGHNGALFEELARELPRLGFAPTFLCSRNLPVGALAAPDATVVPLFGIDGYAPHAPLFASEAAFAAALESIEAELHAVDWQDVAAVLMPTVYPLHLIALARVLPQRLPPAQVPVALGLLMPTSFWASDAAVAEALGELMLTALQALRAHGPALAYAEAGAFIFGAQRLELPRLLPPVAQDTEALIDALRESAARPDPAQALSFGFFGSPFTSKGIERLRQAIAIAAADPAWAHRVELVIPPGHAAVAEAYARLGPRVTVRAGRRDNHDYLRAMAAVDVVLLPYDPAHYRDKLSGVLFEAIALGKPVVVIDGNEPLVQWLDQTAPGAYAVCADDAAALADVLKLPTQAFVPLALAARASAPIVTVQKSMRRFLAAAGVALPAPAPAAQAAPQLAEAATAAAGPPASAAAATAVATAAAATVGEAPIVSIVIPTWNREAMVEAAIESALAQTVRQIEVIVVDNASTDATVAIARRIAARDARVQVAVQPRNLGPVRNWLDGIRRARAPFVKLLFSDDLIDARFVERMLPPLLDGRVAFSICPAVVGEAPWQGRVLYGSFDRPTQLTSDAYEALALSAIGRLPLSPGAGLFRRADLLQSLRTHLEGVADYDFSATGSGVDWLAYLLTARRYPRVAFEPEPLAFFRAHPGSLTIGDRDGHVWRGYELAARWFAQGGAATA
jgi:glycosyltransferase involved in cell wall biosynthesis